MFDVFSFAMKLLASMVPFCQPQCDYHHHDRYRHRIRHEHMKVLLIVTAMVFPVIVPKVNGLAVSPRPGSMPPLFTNQEQQQQQQQHSSDYGKRKNHPTSYEEDPPFKGPLSLTDASSPDLHRQRIRRYYLGLMESNNDDNDIHTSRNRHMLMIPKHKPQELKVTASTEMILKTIVDHLAYSDAPVDAKEVAESVEFYLRCGKRLLGAAKRHAKNSTTQKKDEKENIRGVDNSSKTKAKNAKTVLTVQDLCSGHGFTGLLFAACNPPRSPSLLVKATMVDRFEPPSHKILRDCVAEICPWVRGDDMIKFIPSTLEEFLNQQQQEQKEHLDDKTNGASIVISTHACGSLTDTVMEYAVQSHAAAIAVMPCCYTGTDKGTPYGIRRALGVSMAADIRRSFLLQDHGYHVDFANIPKTITPMNRIIVAERRK